jgi:hypothetical protein
VELSLKVPPELAARIAKLLPGLVALQVTSLLVSRYHRTGKQEYWLAFLYVGEMRHEVGTHELRRLPLTDQAEDLLRQLAGFSPTTLDGQLSELAAARTSRQRRQFASICNLMAAVPKGGQAIFWTSPKGSLAGLAPLEALVAGRYREVRRTAEGYAER